MESSQPTQSAQSTQRESYDCAQLARLFIGSFRFSQGRPELQRSILAHLVQRHGHRMRRELLAEASERATGTLLRVIVNHRLHAPVPPDEAHALIAEQLAAFERLLAEPGHAAAGTPLELAVGMAEADLDYLRRPLGRPRIGEVDTGGSSWVDRRTGLLAYHAVLGNSAGLAEFDEMFAEVGQAVREASPVPEPVRAAVTCHFEHHPEDRAKLVNPDDYGGDRPAGRSLRQSPQDRAPGES
jgi:hypothetical protein